MAFCPTLAAVVLCGMGLHGILSAEAQARLIRDTVQSNLAVAIRLSEDATALQAINGALYRMTTLQASRTRDLDVATKTASLVGQTEGLARDLEGTVDELASIDDRQQLRTLAAAVRTYGKAIEVFGSILELDFTSAVGFIRPFDDNASAVLSQIFTMTRHVHERASKNASDSAAIAERIRIAIVAVSAAGSLLLFGAASLLTRATVRSVKQIASATASVARGNAEVDVDALARGDELGTIVRSLAVFQANVSQIAFLAHHDPLTHLPNRVLFHDRVQQALAQVGRGLGFALFCLDLDRFKVVNDTLGHPVGDLLLRNVSERLQACVREGDTVARLGGDEFAMTLLDVTEAAEADALAARIIEVVSSAYYIDGNQISIGTSIGIAFAPHDGANANDLIKNADTALYEAKANGRGTSCFYEASMNAALLARRALEMSLRQALANQEFVLYYQPLVDARSRRATGVEALIRWQHPERGIISPDDFIPVAESSGLIGAIGEWVLERACVDAAGWPDEIKVAVNLSSSQFRDRKLVDSVRCALEASGLPARRLELEITESVLLRDSAGVLAMLREIKALGVKISMDDFGTGYSSLSYLRSFPFDKIKIDRSFIKDLPNDDNAMAIVRAIVGLSNTFGMTVTAEGVETNAQAMQLALEQCNQLQGYLFGRPQPAAELPALFERLSGAMEAVSAEA